MRGLGCFPLALPRLSFPFSTEFPGPKKVLVRRDLHKAMPNKPLGKLGVAGEDCNPSTQEAAPLCFLLVQCTPWPEATWRRDGLLHFTLPSHNPSMREVRTGIETGHGGTLLTACFLWLAQPPFLYGQGPPAQG